MGINPHLPLLGQDQEPRLLDQIDDIILQTVNDPLVFQHCRLLIREFLLLASSGKMQIYGDLETIIGAYINEIDRLLSLQLNEIIHHSAFQKLESAWRGLWHLVRTTWEFENVKLRVINIQKKEFIGDSNLDRYKEGISLLASGLSLEAGTIPHGEPVSILICNYEFGPVHEDFRLLTHLTEVAEAAYAPVVAGVDPKLLGKHSFFPMSNARDLEKIFLDPSYINWQRTRRMRGFKYVVLALPQFLLRKPFGARFSRKSQFEFNLEEELGDFGHSNRGNMLWGNAAWLIGAQLTRAFGKGSWCADLAAVEAGGTASKIPHFSVNTKDGGEANIGPTDCAIDDQRYAALRELGFAPVCQDETTGRAVLFEIPTAHKARTLEDEDGEKHEPSPTMLREVLMGCRLSQHIACIVRDQRLTFERPEQCEFHLNEWASRYVLPDVQIEPTKGNFFPFLKAELRVVEDGHRRNGLFRVVGEVIPNLGEGEPGEAIQMSVPILLKRSASNRRAQTKGRQEHPSRYPAIAGQGEGGERSRSCYEKESPKLDSFSSACDSLERLADLRERRILDDLDFAELKKLLVGKIKTIISPEIKEQTPDLGPPQALDPVAISLEPNVQIGKFVRAAHQADEDAST